jgi:formiminotetrahydrofolate cyclodeaminase
MITDLTVDGFLDALASSAPTPGGGGAAAAMGAMGAALVAMVCNLTIGKKGYEAVEADVRALLAEAEASRQRLARMVEDDKAAFDTLMAAYRLPKATDEDKAFRSAAIQAGLKAATESPLACARACAEVVRQSARAARDGNLQVISDAGVGVLAAWAGLRSAALNVYINSPQIKDRAWAERIDQELAGLVEECAPLTEHVHAIVRHKLA